jgi:DNA-binding GntR family transcriptional regulator
MSSEPTLHERTYALLRQSLMEGHFKPGESLPIQRVTSAFGVSAMPAREAVRRLVAEGALEAPPNRTTRVPKLTTVHFEHLWQARVVLEGWATEQAAAVCTGPEVKQLRKINEQLRRTLQHGDIEKITDGNRLFHFAIYDLSRNPLVVGMIENLWVRSGPYIRALVETPFYAEMARARGYLHQHDAMLDALQRHKSRVAGDAMRADIASTLGAFRNLLKQAAH